MTTLKLPKLDMTSLDSLTKATLAATESYFRSLSEIARQAFTIYPLYPVMGGFADKPCDRCGSRHSSQCSSCDIPEPCWLPRRLEEVRSFVCPGGTASLRIQLTNCQPRTSAINIKISKPEHGKVNPPSANLEPMERTRFTASFTIPADTARGHQFETLVWVLGCNEYYVRWTIEAAEGISDSCHEICVDDCPDYVHHWYDHFYCDRRCFHVASTRGTQ